MPRTRVNLLEVVGCFAPAARVRNATEAAVWIGEATTPDSKVGDAHFRNRNRDRGRGRAGNDRISHTAVWCYRASRATLGHSETRRISLCRSEPGI